MQRTLLTAQRRSIAMEPFRTPSRCAFTMNALHATPLNPKPPRVDSVDLVRGLTILVMLFVNDVAGVHGTPPWMKHIEPSTADGLTFVDVVFPAFLFIVGLSLPVALERRRVEAGAGLSLARHIAARTLGLLVIGVLLVNTEPMADLAPRSRSFWALLMVRDGAI